ncbi:MAG TPA: nucleoside-diphosphate sugar epimerase/dehydratase [Solirubrobacteraceae bacterium]|jgi:FlaA1/EpsC-like NDP-sugar epimerase|nr:nucleoside-diphosphate sugar epimerase/dehydratase [Solirubrobacteraceae bacterium]
MRRRIRSAALPLHRHSLPQLAVDGALVAFAYYLAFQLRFTTRLPVDYSHLRSDTIWWVLLGSLPVLVLSRVYQRRWRYAGQRDYEAVVLAVALIVLLTVAAIEVARPVHHYIPAGRPAGHATAVALMLPDTVIFLFGLLSLVFLVAVRALARTAYERRPLAAFRSPRRGQRTVLIAGAGDGGRLVAREMLRNRELGLAPVGFVDDDPAKRRLRIEGLRVRGDTEADLPRILDEAEPDEMIIAIPSAPGSMRARIVRECRARAIPVRTLPTVFELLKDGSPTRTLARQVREVRVEDVLGREPVIMELERVGAYLGGATVLVTGAGGSIGSELCRQIARVEPHRIVLLDHAEDNLFSIQRELEDERHVPPSMLAAVLADCKEGERMREVFAEQRPTVVFHAAAYKHVGLMEQNPVEAVRNNAIGTRVVAQVAGEVGVERFVLVSTDKAVAPATVMGASKALAEFALEAAAARFGGTRYAAVRFGNVLGSSGSVVPIFRRQIERGGPVTVTDERMTRYFMTIPEAVQLIIRSGSLASQGAAPTTPERAPGERIVRPPGERTAGGAEVFVLDMGEPVRIVELARAMIDLSGLDPDRDIDVEIVGRRPGEKLHEELFNSYERRRATAAEKIFVAEREPLAVEEVETMFSEIGLLVLEGDAAGLAAKVSELVAARHDVDPGSSDVDPGTGHVDLGAGGESTDARANGAPARAQDADAPVPLVHSPHS